MREVKLNMNGAKKFVHGLVGEQLDFRVNLGRNNIVYFKGSIDAVYPNIFTVIAPSAPKNKYTFTYSDLLTDAVKMRPSASDN